MSAGDQIQTVEEIVSQALPNAIQDPSLRSLLVALKRETMVDINCHQIGRVVGFDATKQTVQVAIQMQRVVYNQTQKTDEKLQFQPLLYSYPLLVDVPVYVPGGGTGTITFPIATGDFCLLLFNDRDIDIWYQGGQVSPPNSGRVHNLSDAFAIVGFHNATNRIADYSTTDVEIRNLAGKIAVAAKIGISNADTSLLLVMDALITALTALNLKTGPSAATQITALQALYQLLLK